MPLPSLSLDPPKGGLHANPPPVALCHGSVWWQLAAIRFTARDRPMRVRCARASSEERACWYRDVYVVLLLDSESQATAVVLDSESQATMRERLR